MLELGIPWSDYEAMPEAVAARFYEVLRERHKSREGAPSPRVTRRMR